MGKRGPAPKPSAIAKLQGNPGKRALNKLEPVSPSVLDISCPEILQGHARAEWERIAPILLSIGVLKQTDLALLAAYCQACGDWQEAVAWMAENGTTMTLHDDVGRVKSVQVVPQYRIARTAAEQMKRFGAEFGLTPSSRTQIKTDAPQTENKWRKFLTIPAGQSSTQKVS